METRNAKKRVGVDVQHLCIQRHHHRPSTSKQTERSTEMKRNETKSVGCVAFVWSFLFRFQRGQRAPTLLTRNSKGSQKLFSSDDWNRHHKRVLFDFLIQTPGLLVYTCSTRVQPPVWKLFKVLFIYYSKAVIKYATVNYGVPPVFGALAKDGVRVETDGIKSFWIFYGERVFLWLFFHVSYSHTHTSNTHHTVHICFLVVTATAAGCFKMTRKMGSIKHAWDRMEELIPTI